MRSSLPVELLLLATSVRALPEIGLKKRDRHNGGKTADVADGMVKVKRQDDTLDTNIFNIITYTTGGAYYANVSVGTPGQQQTVILDTGSSDLYFDASTARACQSNGPYSCRGGEFTPADSSTYEIVVPAPAFDTEFGDGSTASGPFASDTVCISDICVSNVQFGLAQQVHSTTGYSLGLLGLGYSINEASRHQYPNIPEVLVTAGEINSRLYSVYLNNWDDYSGSILFGGIDTSKYTGPLQSVDILPDKKYGFVYQMVTTVTDMTATVNGRSSRIFSGGAPGPSAYFDRTSLPVLLDTGSAAWSVPYSHFPAIAQPFSYCQIINHQIICPCSHRDSDDSITLTFEGKIDINVPVSEFIVPTYDAETGAPQKFPGMDDEYACAFMIVPSEGTGMGFDTLGDAVMRSMYVVFDLDNGQMSIAQAKSGDTGPPQIKSVQAGPNGVAKAAGGSYRDSPGQSYSIAPDVSATASQSHALSTQDSTIGTATGTAAIPADAQISGTSTSTSTGKKDSAGVLSVPSADWTGLWISSIVALMMVLGAGLIL